MLKTVNKSHFYSFTTVFLWAFAYVFTRWVSGDFDPFGLSLLRCATAAAVFALVLRLKGFGLPKLGHYPLFLLSGASGLGVYYIFFNIGLKTVTAATSCIIMSTAPLLTALLASFVFAEKLPGKAWLALGVAFCGILILSWSSGSLSVDAGVLWSLGAALCLTVYNIIQRYCRTLNYTPLQVTAYSFFGACLPLLFFLPEAAADFTAASPTQQAVVVFMGVFPSAIAYMCWTKAMSIASSTSSVANYMFLTPFLALLLGLAVLDEIPPAGALAGGAVILAGLALFGFSTRQPGGRKTNK